MTRLATRLEALEGKLEALEGQRAPVVVVWWDNGDGTCTRSDTGAIVAEADLSPGVVRIRWPEGER
jgi:hypothetical protein